MTWFILTIFLAFIEAVASVIGRFALKHETKDSDYVPTLWGFFAGLMFTTPAIIKGAIYFDFKLFIICFISGALYLTAEHYYFNALSREEVSRVIPILSINPILILIGSTIFFHEFHTTSQYFGMFLIFIGILIHSYNRKNKGFINIAALILALTAALFFASKSLFIKYLDLNGHSPLNILFWMGLSIFVINIPIIIKKFRKTKKLTAKSLGSLSLAASFEAAATLLYTAAISIGPAIIVAFLDRLQILFVFIMSSLINFFYPKILKEKFIKADFFQKLIGVLSILIGSYFLI